jgi:hypothetical protein
LARGTTFGQLLIMLRTEARMDPNPALSKNMLPLMQQKLKRHYERLYDDFDWPFLKVKVDVTLQAGERYYDVPDSINLERIQTIETKWSNEWLPVERGITDDDYVVYDSDTDVRADPAMKWDVTDTGSGEQLEIWPIPSVSGTLRIHAIRKKQELVADGDRCDLDDQLVVLYAAAELLASRKDSSAQVLLTAAKAREVTLMGRLTKTRNKTFVLGGKGNRSPGERRRPRISVAYVR